MTDIVKIEWSDICRHEPKCEGKQLLYHTVPDYRTYQRATHWLRNERDYKLISVAGEGYVDKDGNRAYTGRYTFKFLCEQEYILFVLRWA